jgi:hypothetical protein
VSEARPFRFSGRTASQSTPARDRHIHNALADDNTSAQTTHSNTPQPRHLTHSRGLTPTHSRNPNRAADSFHPAGRLSAASRPLARRPTGIGLPDIVDRHQRRGMPNPKPATCQWPSAHRFATPGRRPAPFPRRSNGLAGGVRGLRHIRLVRSGVGERVAPVTAVLEVRRSPYS